MVGLPLFKVSAFGDSGLRIQFGETISPETNQQIRSFVVLLEQEKIYGILEWIPTYTALSIVYDPYVISYADLEQFVMNLKEKMARIDLPKAEVVHIPTCYGGDKGPDLAQVADHNGLTEEEVVKIHSGTNYLIYMMGFTPGFPYLGGMSKKIATPRLTVPRPKIAPGSVGIAGEQTGIYSMETPGGWQIIGRTPLKLYDPDRDPPILLKAGNYIRFHPVSEEEYEDILETVRNGTFHPHVEQYREEEDGNAG